MLLHASASYLVAINNFQLVVWIAVYFVLILRLFKLIKVH